MMMDSNIYFDGKGRTWVDDPSTEMLISKTFHDVQVPSKQGGRPIRIYVISPVIQNYPHAKFPGEAKVYYVVLEFILIQTQSGVVVFRYA